MKYIKLFKNDAEYQAFIGGGEYITPNVCLNEETESISLEPVKIPSMFPLYLTIDNSWSEDNLDMKDYYWEVNLPDDKLYNILIDAMVYIGDGLGSVTHELPSEWLNENPIYIDGNKVESIFKQDLIYIYIENEYPFNTTGKLMIEYFGRFIENNKIQFYMCTFK